MAPAHSNNNAARWLALATSLGFAKLISFVLDSNPQVFMGDSVSYLTTAMLKWIPPDRSFVYGFLVDDLTARSTAARITAGREAF